MSRKTKKVKPLGKYQSLPKQEFQVYVYTGGRLNSWMERYKVARARGVWMPLITVVAHSPWEACARARVQKFRKGLYHSFKAMPTWKEVE